jgi:hypothetical protein
MELDAFYGDALLEAMLAGDTIYERTLFSRASLSLSHTHNTSICNKS